MVLFRLCCWVGRQALWQYPHHWRRQVNPYRFLVCLGHRAETRLSWMGSISPNKRLYRTVGHLGSLRRLLCRDAEHCETVLREIRQHLEGPFELHRFYGHERLWGNYTKIEILQLKRKHKRGRSGKDDPLGKKPWITETDVLGMASLPLIYNRMHRMRIINNSIRPHPEQYIFHHSLHLSPTCAFSSPLFTSFLLTARHMHRLRALTYHRECVASPGLFSKDSLML